ncbi:hypothetical protein MRB53_021295 [Persea americana]|uniref:Uncharacterized protein n=1 Tax=Persea americana TaxID=3435 RepID=A0ACC2L4M9_PERAE|nr:hypothetical protein MRB53_021295 [Persea americana]
MKFGQEDEGPRGWGVGYSPAIPKQGFKHGDEEMDGSQEVCKRPGTEEQGGGSFCLGFSVLRIDWQKPDHMTTSKTKGAEDIFIQNLHFHFGVSCQVYHYRRRLWLLEIKVYANPGIRQKSLGSCYSSTSMGLPIELAIKKRERLLAGGNHSFGDCYCGLAVDPGGWGQRFEGEIKEFERGGRRKI